MFLQRLLILTKRICTKKLYIGMLALLFVLTGIYLMLPTRSQTASIQVGIYFEEQNAISDTLMQMLSEQNSVYTFYQADDENALTNAVKSGRNECGFVIPADFFENYIQGSSKTAIRLLIIPSQTLSATITETFLCTLYKCVSDKVLLQAAGMPESSEILLERFDGYVNGDRIFQMESLTDGAFSFEETVHKLTIPIREISLLLILFSGLLGLLTFLLDKEAGIYSTLSKSESTSLAAASILSALLPITACGFLASLLSGAAIGKCLTLLAFAGIVFLAVFLLSFCIKKSTLLNKVLPVIMLIAIILVFIQTLRP